MSDEEIWDRDLSPAAWNKIKNKHGPARIEASLRRKVEILEKWSVQGVPSTMEWKKFAGSRTKLRAWHDPTLRLWKWSDDEAEKRPNCMLLLDRWRAVKEILKSAKPLPPEHEMELLKKKITSLELQIVRLIADKAWLEEEVLATHRAFGQSRVR
jgi:hypothetical protein